MTVHRARARALLAAALLGATACTSAAAGVASGGRPGIDVESLNRLFARLPADRSLLAPGHAAARTFLLDALAGFGLKAHVLPVEWDGAPAADLANVEVRLGHEAGDAPLLIVSAHYDTVAGTAGADDNGSGMVVLLELARRLAGRPMPSELRLVWFDAEEPGLIGSGRYVESLSAGERRRLIGAINLETIGYTDRRPGSQALPPGAKALFDPGDRGDFLLVVGNVQSALLGRAVFEGLQPEHGPRFRSELFALLPGAGWLFPDSRRSDHARFWDVELPAVMLTDTANLRSPHYHTPSDTVQTLDLPFLAAAARGLERAVLHLASSPPPAPAGSR
jgi:aminopeptidase YwaD